MTDVTKGTPHLTHGRVLAVATPMVLSNATVPLVGLVDTAVVGQLGQAAPIGAVAVGASLLTACYWIFGFLRMGTTGLAAQAIGAGDRDETVALLSRAVLIGLGAGVFLILVQVPLFDLAFGLSSASPEVQALAEQYLAIRIWSAPALIASYGLTGWLIAQGRTGAVLTVQIITNGVNISFDLVFVLGFGWGVPGVALATFLAEWAGLITCLWFCRDVFYDSAWRNWAKIMDRGRLVTMAVLNIDITVRSALLLAVMVSFISTFSPKLGDVTLAANQILLQFISLASFGLDGFAYTAESLVGQAVGAKDRQRFRRAVRLCALWCFAVAVVLSVVFFTAGGLIIDTMTTAPEVRVEARGYLLWMVACPLVAFAAYILDGVFIGATRGRDMRNMMVISAGVYFAAAMALVPVYGNNGLWAALLLCFAARGVTLAFRYPALDRALD